MGKAKLSGELTTSSEALRTYVADVNNNIFYDSNAPTPNVGVVTTALNDTNLRAKVVFTIPPTDTTSAGLTLSTTNLTIDVKQVGLTPPLSEIDNPTNT